MGSSRLTLLIVMAALAALAFSFRGFRAQVEATLAAASAAILGEDPDEHYRLAERYYQAGDFEKADLSCRRALELAPSHAPAFELRKELRFVLGIIGRGAPGPAQHSRTLIEIERGLASGDAFLRAGDGSNAEGQFRLVLEYAKGLPASVEIDLLCERARLGLEACSVQE